MGVLILGVLILGVVGCNEMMNCWRKCVRECFDGVLMKCIQSLFVLIGIDSLDLSSCYNLALLSCYHEHHVMS